MELKTYEAEGESGRSKEIFGGWVRHVDAHGNVGLSLVMKWLFLRRRRERERGIDVGSY